MNEHLSVNDEDSAGHVAWLDQTRAEAKEVLSTARYFALIAFPGDETKGPFFVASVPDSEVDTISALFVYAMAKAANGGEEPE